MQPVDLSQLRKRVGNKYGNVNANTNAQVPFSAGPKARGSHSPPAPAPLIAAPPRLKHRTVTCTQAPHDTCDLF